MVIVTKRAAAARGAGDKSRGAVGRPGSPTEVDKMNVNGSNCKPGHEHHESGDEDEILDVIIVGAGWAGVAAAVTLATKNRMDNILVLEARDYVGGRSRTTRDLAGEGKGEGEGGGGAPPIVDLGSSWIQGTRNNPVQALAKKHGVPCGRTRDTWTVLAPVPDGREGERQWLSSSDAEKLYDGHRKDFMKFVARKRRGLGGGGGGGRFLRGGKKHASTGNDTDLRAVADEFVRRKNMTEEERRGFEWMLDEEIAMEYAAPLNELSLRWWDADEELGGGDSYLAVDGGGYSAVVEAYAKPVLDKIRLRARVTDIDYEGETARVTYMDMDKNAGGDGTERTVLARHVIVTLPLGVLKEGSVRFRPPLPAAKRKAIQDLGFGLMNKVALHWEGMAESDIFWPRGEEWIMSVAPSAEEQGLWTEFYNAHGLNGQTTLIGFVVGEHARRMEALSDEEAARGATEALRRMFGADSVPDPSSYVVTRWGSDKYSRGSYSFQKVGSDGQSRGDLAGDVSGRLWFAGEATDARFPATTHGALMSGERAARKVATALLPPRRGPFSVIAHHGPWPCIPRARSSSE